MQLLVSRKEKIYMNSRIRKAVSALSCIALLVAALLGAFPLEVSAAAAPYAVSDAYAASVYYQRLNAVILGSDMRQNIVNVALSQVGYHEGNSVKDLGGGNTAGSRDYTEYGYYYGTAILGNQNGYFLPWCALFVSWCARMAGIPTNILNVSPIAYAGANRGFMIPCYTYTAYCNILPGDLVFLEYNNDGYGFDHVGLVYKVDDRYIYTVDGNYSRGVSDKAKYDRKNGCDVWDSNTRIANYGVPAYTTVTDATVVDPGDPYGGFPEPQRHLSLSSPVMKGTDVSWVQYTLNELGYTLVVDGSFGRATDEKVRLFQSACGLPVTGIVNEAVRSKIRQMVDTYVIISTDPPDGYFADVAYNAWYYNAVQAVYVRNLFSGTGAYIFEPETTMTRAMFVSVLWRLDGSPVAAPCNFADIPRGKWYTAAVDWATVSGVVSGVDATHFAPDATVTREQIAALLYRYAIYKGYDTTQTAALTFSDAAQVSAFAEQPLRWALGMGFVSGRGGGILAPLDGAKRAEVASIFMRFAGLYGKEIG